MTEFYYHIQIRVRYGDLDPQWHVNNARFLTFLEQARMTYLVKVGIFDGKSFIDLPLIVADAHISFLAPIEFGETVDVRTRVSKIGNKSMMFEYEIASVEENRLYARAETVMVAYDYHTKTSIPVPDEWRQKVSAFEKREL